MTDSRGKFEYNKDKAGEWRWHYVSASGRITYASSEGYKNKKDCLLSIPRCSEVESAFRVDLSDVNRVK